MTQPSPVGPPPPFDPTVAAMLAVVHEILPADGLVPERILDCRAATAERMSGPVEELARGGEFTVEERAVPGPEGAPDVPLLICRPSGVTGPTGVVYYIHGGGMVMGTNRHGMSDLLDLALDLRLTVVSVEYRLAPEHPHPAPVEDCYAGLLWTAGHAEELGLDLGRVIVAGTSAGGGLAAAVALLARDRKGPALAGQMLVCPMLDDRNDTPSSFQMAGLGLWDRTCNDTGWTALLGDARGGRDVSPYAAPARAEDLSGLPPAFIDAGSAETFRDEDVAYATGIWRAGGVAELHVWPGGCHGFDEVAPHAAISIEAKEARRRWARRVLAS